MAVITNGRDVIGCNQRFLEFSGVGSLDEFRQKHRDVSELFVAETGHFYRPRGGNWLPALLQTPGEERKVKMYDEQLGRFRRYALRTSPCPGLEKMEIVAFLDATEVLEEARSAPPPERVDSLTGVASTLVLYETGEEEVYRAARYKSNLALLLVVPEDEEEGKEGYTSTRYRQMMKTVATVLEGKLRESDTLARWGEKGFVMLLPETDRTGAAKLGEKLGVALQKEIERHGKTVACYFGATDFLHEDRLDTMLRRAMQGVEAAREMGPFMTGVV